MSLGALLEQSVHSPMTACVTPIVSSLRSRGEQLKAMAKSFNAAIDDTDAHSKLQVAHEKEVEAVDNLLRAEQYELGTSLSNTAEGRMTPQEAESKGLAAVRSVSSQMALTELSADDQYLTVLAGALGRESNWTRIHDTKPALFATYIIDTNDHATHASNADKDTAISRLGPNADTDPGATGSPEA